MPQTKFDKELGKAAELIRRDLESKADDIMTLAPTHNQAITVPERRPRAVGDRVFEMTTVEDLAKTGLNFDEIVDKLRINKALLHERPDIEDEIRQACASGKADLMETLKGHLLKHSEKNVVGTIFALKSYGGDEFDEKRKRGGPGNANPQELVNGMVEEMLARKKLEREEMQNQIKAEQARRTGRGGAVIVGVRDLQTATPVCPIEPVEDITDNMDMADQVNRKESLLGIQDADEQINAYIDSQSSTEDE